MARVIGTLGEKSLHAALKAHYAQPGDRLECNLNGYVIDILRSDERGCVEIQTRSLAKMKPKLRALLDQYPVRVVYPVAYERHVIRIDADGVIGTRRKSPKRGRVYHVFPELVSLPAFLGHPNLTIDVLLIRDEQILIDDGQGSWRRKHWSIHDRRLIEVVESVALTSKADYAALVPASLPAEFDSGELASAIRQPRPLAQKMAYCLREMGVFQLVGKRGKSLLYTLSNERT